MPVSKKSIKTAKRKAMEWIARYLPAEIIATIMAIIGARIAFNLTGSYAAAAVAGVATENVGYYGYFLTKEILRHYRAHSQHSPLRRSFLTAVKTIRDMLTEFGLAEFLYGFVFGPFFMYWGPQILSNFSLGILVGKLLADACFYSIAIVGYEIRKRWA